MKKLEGNILMVDDDSYILLSEIVRMTKGGYPFIKRNEEGVRGTVLKIVYRSGKTDEIFFKIDAENIRFNDSLKASMYLTVEGNWEFMVLASNPTQEQIRELVEKFPILKKLDSEMDKVIGEWIKILK